MTKEATLDKLRQVKLTLAAKYATLANKASSGVKRQTFLHKSEKYRQQVAQLTPRQDAESGAARGKQNALNK